jgi:hypothetical protein
MNFGLYLFYVTFPAAFHLSCKLLIVESEIMLIAPVSLLESDKTFIYIFGICKFPVSVVLTAHKVQFRSFVVLSASLLSLKHAQ